MTKQTLKLFWQATMKYKGLAIWSEIGATGFVLCNFIFPPLIISQVINQLAHAQQIGLHMGDFTTEVLLFGVNMVGYFVFGRIMMQTYIRYEPKVIRDLEILCFKKLQQHSLAFFSNNFSGALVAKVNRFTNAYTQTLNTLIGNLGMLARQFLISLIILFFINWTIGIVFLVWAVLFCYSVVRLHARKAVRSRAAASAQTRVTARLADIITNTLTIRSFARGTQETNDFEHLSDERHRLRLHNSLMGEYIRMYKSMANMAMTIGTLLLCIYLVVTGKINVGEVVLIQLYLFRLGDAIWNFGKVMDTLEESLSDAVEMTEIIMTPHEVSDPARPEAVRIHEGRVELRHVDFRYPEGEKGELLFKDLSLTIPRGQKVGLVGPSGGGKTTLTKLLLRFMDIDDGEILIDGQNIAKIRQDDLRFNISYVPQEPLLFHRSIYENIAYAQPDASREQVLEAARMAHVAEFIENLPHGYDTIVGERGVKLSGGQRQRVAIARAMLKNAPVIVLDEATSSLDSVSERHITEALDELMKGRTTIVVAHRLSTIRRLDRILVMEDGRIVEDGSHDELLEEQRLYARLWQHQTGAFIGVR